LAGAGGEKKRLPPLRITTAGDFYSIPEPADILRMATQSLPKVEALLAECAKHEDFVPPAAYTEERLRAAEAAAAAAEAKAQQEQAAMEATTAPAIAPEEALAASF
jgi:hypothetical protein